MKNVRTLACLAAGLFAGVAGATYIVVNGLFGVGLS